jgi:acetyltransferase-like isoleucine patch superfamily enzyme
VVGERVTVGRGVRFALAPGAEVRLEAGAVVGDRCRFEVASGTVLIGAGATLGERCVIVAAQRVVVGAGSVLAAEVVLCDVQQRYDDVERPVRLQGIATAPVVLGEGVRVGPRAAVLRGVTVGAGALIGAQAVVTRGVAAGATVTGVPAAPPAPARRARRARAARARR